MKPNKDLDYINIPLTFDRGSKESGFGKNKAMISVLLTGVWVFATILTFLVREGVSQFIHAIMYFVVYTYIMRFLVINEHVYRKKRKELVENNYMFPYSVFWDIYDISSRHPYVVSYRNGLKAIFVALDKDVTVGKTEDHRYLHHEAISEAYRDMARRGISCLHIDYMDVVGKDTRLDRLFEQTEEVENDDLRQVLLRQYDYIRAIMNNAYTSYDVYVFFFTGNGDVFWKHLQRVLEMFKRANYIRARVLDREAITALVEPVLGIRDFSYSRATSAVFQSSFIRQYIRPIWVEKDGERTELNKTLEELAELERVRKAEKKVRKKVRRGKKELQQEDIELFD